MQKGQISIDYAGGAMVFFVALIFVVTGMLGTIPQFSEAVTTDRLETVGWSLSTHLLNQPGYWQQGVQNRTDWHAAPSTDQIDSLGLASPEGGVSLEKINEMQDMEYTTIKGIVNIHEDFTFDVTEYMIVTTDSTFEKGSPPWNIEDIDWQGNSDTVWYGAVTENQATQYFMIDRDPSFTIYTSSSRNFDTYDTISREEASIIDFGDRSYILEQSGSGVSQSQGRQLILERSIGRIGERTPPEEAQTVNIVRYSWTDRNPIRIQMEVWD